MKRSIVAAFGFLTLAAAMPAAAADLPRGAVPYKAPAYVAQYNWTGFYLGINGGGAWGDSDWDGFAVANKPTGGDIAWADINDSVACGAVTCETKINWFGTARGRAGYAFDRFLPYITGGAAFADIEANRVGFVGASDTNVGWTVGVGLEGAIANNWTAKIEYLYTDLGNTTCSAVNCGVATNVDLQLNVLRGGLNYRF